MYGKYEIYWNSSSERRRAFSVFLVFLMFPVLMALFPAVSPMSTKVADDAGAAARTTPLGTTGTRAGA